MVILRTAGPRMRSHGRAAPTAEHSITMMHRCVQVHDAGEHHLTIVIAALACFSVHMVVISFTYPIRIASAGLMAVRTPERISAHVL